jgi:hypothetical protein
MYFKGQRFRTDPRLIHLLLQHEPDIVGEVVELLKILLRCHSIQRLLTVGDLDLLGCRRPTAFVQNFTQSEVGGKRSLEMSGEIYSMSAWSKI